MRQEMQPVVKFCLSYGGNESDNQQIDLYDVSQAMIGFQRSIALTTHLVINGEIITQAPALKGARILADQAKEGSWQIVATLLVGGISAILLAPKNTLLGHLVHSVYDYVLFESLGIHADYEKSIGQIVEEYKRQSGKDLSIEQHKVDSLIEKCTTAITDIHRPISKSETATIAKIITKFPSEKIQVGPELTLETLDYICEEFTGNEPVVIEGRISSYNSNTYKGRIYVATEGRPIPFELEEFCRTNSVIGLVTASLSASAVKDYENEGSTIYCRVFRNTSRSGHLKSYKIIEVSHAALQ